MNAHPPFASVITALDIYEAEDEAVAVPISDQQQRRNLSRSLSGVRGRPNNISVATSVNEEDLAANARIEHGIIVDMGSVNDATSRNNVDRTDEQDPRRHLYTLVYVIVAIAVFSGAVAGILFAENNASGDDDLLNNSAV